MKTGKRSLSLAMSILAIASLTACDDDYNYPDAKWKEGIIVNVDGKDYKYDEIYQLFDNSKGSAQAYFNVAKNILAQLVTPKTDTMLSNVDTKINDLKNTWKTNARTNNTSYKEEQEKTFDSENVEDLDELREKYISQQQVEKNSQDFYEINANGVTDPSYTYYISEQMTKDYVTNQAPYHVSHVLVKVDASSDGEGYWNGKITADNAKKIGNAVRMLASSDSFGSVAQLVSEDEGSAKMYGELVTTTEGSQSVAMEKTTSYINEFKLGLYAYEAYLNPKTKAAEVNTAVRASLRVPGQAAVSSSFDYKNDTAVSELITDGTLVGKNGAFGIPLSKAITLGYVADVEKNIVDGSKVDYASETQYPRNILFNNYFNYHGVNFLYDDSDTYEAEFLKDAIEVGAHSGEIIHELKDVENKLPSKYAEYEYVTGQLSKIDAGKFKTVEGISDNLYNYNFDAITKKSVLTKIPTSKKILVEKDTDTNPVIIVRGGSSGYQGIHFIVVNNDPFVNSQNTYQYYRTNIPDASADPASAKSADYSTNPSLINYVKADINSNTTYNARRDAVVAAVKASDSNIDFRLYEENIKKFGADKFNELLGDYAGIINKYIEITKESSELGKNSSLDESWETYIQTLALQEEITPRGLVPEVCVSAFEGGNYGTLEGICHVEK
ncbi:MAG: hypothetical protein SPG94_03270 [Candidatus Enterosoma sp.]|nr:hypothetical protein [bacterium]MDY5548299.1 hypothetical protein [Candidatus Enterosoma sp.]